MAEEDSEGLLKHYDLIVLGTGLTESMVSCAAGRAGLKVLHLDPRDYYGNKYNANSLDCFLKDFANSENKLPVEQPNSAEAASEQFIPLAQSVEDVFIADFKSLSSTKLTPASYRFDSSRLHPCCLGYQMEKECSAECTRDTEPTDSQSDACHPVFQDYRADKEVTLSRALLKSRDFSIDTTSKVLLSSGMFIECLINSGVHKYLEFKSIEGLYYYVNEHATNASNKNIPNELWKVPCSRTDVFNTTKLSVLEKRVLMKFYSFVLDYGKIHYSNIEVYSLNEIELASGRSLYRPQNKEKALPLAGLDGSASTTGGYNVVKFLNLPFEDFLTDSKISKRLQWIIMYSLCFRTSAPQPAASTDKGTSANNYTTSQGIYDLYQHINSLGRFGETAFLTPLYGTAEIVQAYCRMSAVWGGVFILRRGVDAVCIDTPAPTSGTGAKAVSKETEKTEDAAAAATTAATGPAAARGTTVPSESTAVSDAAASAVPSVNHEAADSSTKLTHVKDSTGRVFSCDAFVCGINAWPALPVKSTQLSVTRVSVCKGYLLPLSRAVAILPPMSTYTVRESTVAVGESSARQKPVEVAVNNTHAVHIVQSADNSTYTAIEGTSLLHITTTIAVTQGTNEGPTDGNSWRAVAEQHRQQATELMDRVMDLLQHSSCFVGSGSDDRTTAGDEKQQELAHTTYITPLYQSSSADDSSGATVPSNVGLCFDSSESFHMSAQVEQARGIFGRLFPGKSFFPSDEEREMEEAAAAEAVAALVDGTVTDSTANGGGAGDSMDASNGGDGTTAAATADVAAEGAGGGQQSAPPTEMTAAERRRYYSGEMSADEQEIAYLESALQSVLLAPPSTGEKRAAKAVEMTED